MFQSPVNPHVLHGLGSGGVDVDEHSRTTPTSTARRMDRILTLPQKPVNSISMLHEWGGGVEVEQLCLQGRPWQYRGEGNANIVLALQDDMRVLRLSKARLEGEGVQSRRRVEREVAFANSVFIPLLGVEYVGVVQAVHLSQAQIHQLNLSLTPLRPDYRLHKSLGIPWATAHRDFARIHPDPGAGPGRRKDYCVEIKPKQGWWPKHLHHTHKCTYCLNQFLKLERSKITSRTGYCPLDLFSGIAERIIDAILALVSNPQNNLRIFRDGCLVYGENTGGGRPSLQEILAEWMPDTEVGSFLPNFVFLLATALLKPKRTPPFSPVCREFNQIKAAIGDKLRERKFLENDIQDNIPGSMKDSKGCDATSLPLPDGSILSRILDIQRMADIPGGVDSLYALHSRICPVHSNPGDGSSLLPSGEEIIQGLATAVKKKRRRRGQRRSGDSSASSSNEDDGAYELDLDSNCSSSSSHRGRGQKISVPDPGQDQDTTLDEEEAETSGHSSLSQDEEEDTLREELLKCPGPHCLSLERWLDEVQATRELSPGQLADMEAYLIAATAKDCSIMITFSPISGERARERTLSEVEGDSITTLYSPRSPSICNYADSDLILQDLGGAFHRVRIGVADLDPKPVSCVAKHFLRDRDMLADWLAYNGGRNGCGDD